MSNKANYIGTYLYQDNIVNFYFKIKKTVINQKVYKLNYTKITTKD